MQSKRDMGAAQAGSSDSPVIYCSYITPLLQLTSWGMFLYDQLKEERKSQGWFVVNWLGMQRKTENGLFYSTA